MHPPDTVTEEVDALPCFRRRQRVLQNNGIPEHPVEFEIDLVSDDPAPVEHGDFLARVPPFRRGHFFKPRIHGDAYHLWIQNIRG